MPRQTMRTRCLTFEFDNVGDFVSGAFAEVFLLGKSVPGVISVPVTALTESQGVYYLCERAKDMVSKESILLEFDTYA